MDQDILNVSCLGKIKKLPIKFNLMTKYLNDFAKYQDIYEITDKDFINVLKDPYIIHFADKIKPWTDVKSLLAPWFWMYAVRTPYYHSICAAYNCFNNNENTTV